VTVSELLRLAPFSLATITLLLASIGLLYSHAYGRYGDDAALGFVMRVRFLLAVAAPLIIPALMLISFGNDDVPSWLTPSRAALLIGFGLLTTLVTAAYFVRSVGRPSAFLSAVGKKVRVGRLNRYAQSRDWRDSQVFYQELGARQYNHAQKANRFGGLGRAWLKVKMHCGRLLLRMWRTDPTEMLFDAAAAGTRNANARTWRAALDMIGRRLQSPKLRPLASKAVVDNALVLEEAAHRYNSEDCKVRLAHALGEVGRVPLDPEAAEILAFGISELAERRLLENRPVNAAVDAIESLAVGNPRAAAKVSGWLGQHLAALSPPLSVRGEVEHVPEHPTLQLIELLSELAERARQDDDGELNAAVIDACDAIADRLPGHQDCETIRALGGPLASAGREGARRYGEGADWHGTLDAARSLRSLYRVLVAQCAEADQTRGHSWVLESMAAIGSWALGNRDDTILNAWHGRSDMGPQVAQQLDGVPRRRLGHSVTEFLTRQHYEDVPRELRQEFVGICQRMHSDLLGFEKPFDVPGLDSDPAPANFA
jgi:hypothetical protein